METRPYFVFGDLVSNVLAGIVTALSLSLMFGPGWNMWVAMIIGMVLGMLITLPIAFLFGALFGAMEIMLPVMTTGMVAGMVVSMSGAMADVGMMAAIEYGALSGLGVMVVTYLLNAIVKPRAKKWTT